MWLGRPSSHSSYREFTKSFSICHSDNCWHRFTLWFSTSFPAMFSEFRSSNLSICSENWRLLRALLCFCPPTLISPPATVSHLNHETLSVQGNRPHPTEAELVSHSPSEWCLIKETYPSTQDATHRLSLFLGICLSCFSTFWVPHLPLGSHSTMWIFRRCYIILQTYEASVVLKYSSIPFKINNLRHLGGPPGTSADSGY